MKKRWVCLLCATALIFQGCSNRQTSQEAVRISFNFPPGSGYTYAMDTRQTIRQQTAGMNTLISQHMKLRSSYKVQGVSGNRKRMTINYDRFYIQSSSNGMLMEYDSDDSTRQPAELAGAGNMVNHPFSIIVDPQGAIMGVERSTDSASGSNSAFSDSTIRQMMEQSLNVYPDRPVKPGDSWQRSFNTNVAFMDMSVLSTYKLVSVTEGIAHIEINATIKSKPSANLQQQQMQMSMAGTQTGTMDIDVKTGLIQDSQFTQHIKGSMQIPGAEIPMELTSDTRILGRMK